MTESANERKSERAEKCMLPVADEVRLPMQNLEKPWYEATRVFGPYNVHPGRCEDWNLESGGNTDLGEPLVAPWSGVVIAAAQYFGGIGRVIQILGLTPEGELIVWCGWHLHEMYVKVGQVVEVGQVIGSIGNADGRYAGAHLHEQICIVGSSGIPGPRVFASDRRYEFVQPSRFYAAHGVSAETIRRVTAKDGR